MEFKSNVSSIYSPNTSAANLMFPFKDELLLTARHSLPSLLSPSFLNSQCMPRFAQQSPTLSSIDNITSRHWTARPMRPAFSPPTPLRHPFPWILTERMILVPSSDIVSNVSRPEQICAKSESTHKIKHQSQWTVQNDIVEINCSILWRYVYDILLLVFHSFLSPTN